MTSEDGYSSNSWSMLNSTWTNENYYRENDDSALTERQLLLDGVQTVAFKVLIPPIVTFGCVGNIINIVVLTRKSMKSSTNRYLTCLAVYDILYLVFAFSMILKHYHCIGQLISRFVPFPSSFVTLLKTLKAVRLLCSQCCTRYLRILLVTIVVQYLLQLRDLSVCLSVACDFRAIISETKSSYCHRDTLTLSTTDKKLWKTFIMHLFRIINTFISVFISPTFFLIKALKNTDTFFIMLHKINSNHALFKPKFSVRLMQSECE